MFWMADYVALKWVVQYCAPCLEYMKSIHLDTFKLFKFPLHCGICCICNLGLSFVCMYVYMYVQYVKIVISCGYLATLGTCLISRHKVLKCTFTEKPSTIHPCWPIQIHPNISSFKKKKKIETHSVTWLKMNTYQKSEFKVREKDLRFM